MASMLKRFTRTQVKEKVSKSFRTVIYPDKDEIQICPKFRNDWSDHLENQPCGFLLHSSGNNVMLMLEVDEGNCYMTSGRMASILYGFKKPVEVIVDYQFSDNENCFKLRSIKGKEVIDLTRDDDAVEDDVADNTYTLHEFDNDRVFGWELIVKKSYACAKKPQVLDVPPRMAESVLCGRESIVLKTRHNLDGTVCKIKTYVRDKKPEKKEMYLTEGWFAFSKANRLKKGDKLEFQLSDPPYVIVIDIIRRRR